MKRIPLEPSSWARMFLHDCLQPGICKIHWKNMYVFFMAPFGEAIFSIVCFIAWLQGDISTFAHRIWPHFVKKCSPPTVGSMILKTAHKQNHETYASWALQLGQSASFLHHLFHFEFRNIHEKSVHVLLMNLLGKLYLTPSASSHASNMAVSHSRIVSAMIL